ncbi:MAG: hypothetical protein AAGC60_01760 [Acidobacteriota bacterium]
MPAETAAETAARPMDAAPGELALHQVRPEPPLAEAASEVRAAEALERLRRVYSPLLAAAAPGAAPFAAAGRLARTVRRVLRMLEPGSGLHRPVDQALRGGNFAYAEWVIDTGVQAVLQASTLFLHGVVLERPSGRRLLLVATRDACRPLLRGLLLRTLAEGGASLASGLIVVPVGAAPDDSPARTPAGWVPYGKRVGARPDEVERWAPAFEAVRRAAADRVYLDPGTPREGRIGTDTDGRAPGLDAIVVCGTARDDSLRPLPAAEAVLALFRARSSRGARGIRAVDSLIELGSGASTWCLEVPAAAFPDPDRAAATLSAARLDRLLARVDTATEAS